MTLSTHLILRQRAVVSENEQNNVSWGVRDIPGQKRRTSSMGNHGRLLLLVALAASGGGKATGAGDGTQGSATDDEGHGGW